MDVPDTALYRDITANTPISLKATDVDSFLNEHEDKLDKKAKQLYEERYVGCGGTEMRRVKNKCDVKKQLFISQFISYTRAFLLFGIMDREKY